VNPAKNWLSVRIHQPALATFLTTVTTIFLLGTVLAFVGLALTRELTTAYDALSRRSLEEGGWPALVTRATDWVVDALATHVPVNKEAIRTEFLVRMKVFTGYLLKNVGAAIGGVTSVLITGLLVSIFLYFLLRHGEDWVNQLAVLLPLDPDVSSVLFRTVRGSIVASVNGVLVVAAAQGLLLGLGFWFVGVRSPVLWGTVGGLASVIPIVGSPLVWIPIVIAFLVMGSYWKALVLGVWSGVIVGSVDNVLRPLVVGAGGKQHPVVIALAAIGGTFAFGALGIILGPLVISFLAALLREIQKVIWPRGAPWNPQRSLERL
jgi:predicted PurR-regulated permease PerM